MRLTWRMGVLSVAIVIAGEAGMAPAVGAQYSYVPSPPPCPAAPPPMPPAVKRPKDVVTVAVLALHLQRASASARYLADAFPDAIARRLSALPRIALFAPYAVRRLPPTTAANAARVAREMGVRYVLTGLLTAQGGDARLEVVLYDTLASVPAWRQAYKVDDASLAGAEPSAATEVAVRLLGTLTDEERGAWRGAPRAATRRTSRTSRVKMLRASAREAMPSVPLLFIERRSPRIHRTPMPMPGWRWPS